jgi:hypothetical protein
MITTQLSVHTPARFTASTKSWPTRVALRVSADKVIFPQPPHKNQIVKNARPARQRYQPQNGVRRGRNLIYACLGQRALPPDIDSSLIANSPPAKGRWRHHLVDCRLYRCSERPRSAGLARELANVVSEPLFDIPGLVEAMREERLDAFLRGGPF